MEGSRRYCNGFERGIYVSFSVSARKLELGWEWWVPNGWEEIYVGRKKEGKSEQMRMRTGRLEEFETFAIWESGGLTSPMTSPLLPDWRFSTLHQTPCPIFNRRSSRLVSVSDSDRGRDRDGWVKNERESVWRVDTRAALDCSKEKS